MSCKTPTARSPEHPTKPDHSQPASRHPASASVAQPALSATPTAHHDLAIVARDALSVHVSRARIVARAPDCVALHALRSVASSGSGAGVADSAAGSSAGGASSANAGCHSTSRIARAAGRWRAGQVPRDLMRTPLRVARVFGLGRLVWTEGNETKTEKDLTMSGELSDR